MKSIAAINLEIGKDLVVDEIEIPDPRPDQVVVKLSSSGVCHSQLHQIHQPDLPRPWMLGHEGTGVVTESCERRGYSYRNLGSEDSCLGEAYEHIVRRDLS